MVRHQIQPVWKERYKNISKDFDEIIIPDTVEHLSQDEEWFEFVSMGNKERIRIHDYPRVYGIPGAYEELVYNKLKCCSPSYVVNLLEGVVDEYGEKIEDMRVLDLGSGNGMVGDELASRGIRTILGIDLIPEAKDAALRDRPGIYSDYIVADLTDLSPNYETTIREAKLDCITVVAALGFGMPPYAFLKALGLIETPSWLGLSINENFLKYDETSGFNKLIRFLSREEYIGIYAYRRYKHRLSVSGEPIYYVAIAARKIRSIPNQLFKKWKNM